VISTEGLCILRSMPPQHYHLKCGFSLLALLDERWAGFCPLCEMEKLLNDPETPPKVKTHLRKDLAAYTGAAVKSRLFLPDHVGKEQGHNESSRPRKALDV
jgi:hypothetical protein